ncbi:MAG: glutaredoxin family protein, partial [Nitrospirae bacterium]|nr:glutaredoxin family protein [Nitrospirota bacterium]
MEAASRRPGWVNRAGRLLVLVCCLLSAAAVPNSAAGSEAASPPEIEVFVREGCPHCAAAKLFLNNLQQERPGLRIVIRDVAQDPAARARLNELGSLTGTRVSGVPVFHIRGELLVGFAGEDTTGRQLRTLLDQPSPSRAEPDSIDTRWFGRLSVQDLGLPAFTLALGLLDGFNPCSMWVLLFMLSMLATLQDRWKMLLIAGTFI